MRYVAVAVNDRTLEVEVYGPYINEDNAGLAAEKVSGGFVRAGSHDDWTVTIEPLRRQHI